MNRPLCIASLLFCLVSVCFGQYNGPVPLTQMAPTEPSAPSEILPLLDAVRPMVTIQPEDTLGVQVFGLAMTYQQRVAVDGSLVFPFVGRMEVKGLTIEELENMLTSKLKSGGIVRDPQVTVTYAAQPSWVVSMSGEFVRQGSISAIGPRTLADYISLAGGLQPTASTVVTLVRPTLPNPISIPLGPDPSHSPYAKIPIFAGDEIRASSVGVYYAIGALGKQGVFGLKTTSPTTILQAVAMAGGIGFQADARDTKLVRLENNRRVVYSINLPKILSGKHEDIALKSDDILLVPTNQMKAALKGGAAAMAVSLSSAFIYTTLK